jgi:spermidine synthase
MLEELPQKLLSTDELSELLKNLFGGSTFVDMASQHRLVMNGVDGIVASATTPYQRVDIFHTPHFGLILALDGIVQLAQSDEHMYHELLIHPPSLVHSSVRRVLILGGGDGCAVRELLKYDCVQTIDLVEIDQTVIDLCRYHLLRVHQGSFEDPRVEIIVAEGESYLREHPDKRYDLIVADLTDPYSTSGQWCELSRHIFSRASYDLLKGHLNPAGILVIQTGGLTFRPEVDRNHVSLIAGLKGAFQTVATAYEYIPSFDQIWSITLASEHPYDILGLDPDRILKDKGIGPLKYYDLISHRKAFQKPRHVRDMQED